MLLLCSRCGKVVILNVYQCCVIFVCFLGCVLGVFNSPVATTTHGLLGLSPSLRLRFTIYRRTPASFVYLCHHPWSYFTQLLTRTRFFGPCLCSYIFVLCLAFRVHVAALQVTWRKQHRS